MHKAYLPDEERLLAQRLRQEGRASRPDFSAALHSRICGAVFASKQPVSPSRHVASAGRIVAWFAAVAVILAALAVPAALWIKGQEPDQAPLAMGNTQPAEPDSSDDLANMTALVANAADNLGELVRSEVAEGQWAGLDHAAQDALQSFADRLPIDLSSALAFSEMPDPSEK